MEVEGMTLKMGNSASPEVCSTILGFREIPKLAKTRSQRDRTEVTDTQQKLYPGQEQASVFTLVCKYYAGNTLHEALQTAYGAKSADNYKIVGSDSLASEWPFTAYVSGLTTPGGAVDEDTTFDVTFMCTVNPTLT
jgi:hypothetical protein